MKDSVSNISRYHVKQARVEIIEPDCPPNMQPFVEYITATQHEYCPTLKDSAEKPQRYWLISGDNTGSQQLILWPHQVGPMIDLLKELETEDGFDEA